MNGLIELQYFPGVAYFSLLGGLDRMILESQEHYIKQSLRNRCWINTSNGPATLVVPIAGHHGKLPHKAIRIHSGKQWQNTHWRALTTSYSKAPYFEHYGEQVHTLLFAGHDFLFDLSLAALEMCMGWLGVRTPLDQTTDFTPEPPTSIRDFRNRLGTKKPDLRDGHFQPRVYTQVFGNSFFPNLSILDLVFCEGPRAAEIVAGSVLELGGAFPGGGGNRPGVRLS